MKKDYFDFETMDYMDRINYYNQYFHVPKGHGKTNWNWNTNPCNEIVLEQDPQSISKRIQSLMDYVGLNTEKTTPMLAIALL